MEPRRPSKALRRSVILGALLLAPIFPAASAGGQAAFPPEPTYRFAGRFEGEWTSEALQFAQAPGTDTDPLVVAEPGRLRGRMTVDVGCDGTLTGRARGQTEAQPRFTATYFSPAGQRVTRAALDVVAEMALDGRLAAGSALGQPARVD